MLANYRGYLHADGYLLSCGRYIERNPLEVGLVRLPWEYAWSSCRAYALDEADALLAANPWYEALSGEASRRQGLWQQFLLGEDPKEAAVRRSDRVIGSDAFRRRLQQAAGRPLPRRRARPSRGAGA